MSEVPDDWKGRIAWLKDQARQAYIWNEELGYWEVKERWHYEGRAPFIPTPPTEFLRDAFQYEATWHKNHPSLASNRLMLQWPKIQPTIKNLISDFFESYGLRGFDFFDHGGRAIVFRAQDRAGRYRIARMEADYGETNRTRVVHPAVLPIFSTNENDLATYANVKLEIMPEIVPLKKMHGRPSIKVEQSLRNVFFLAVDAIAKGTNLTYQDISDLDADLSNVGILPDGRVVTFDTMFEQGNWFPRKWFSEEHISLADQIYGMSPDAKFF